jgi:hypothetical protein
VFVSAATFLSDLVDSLWTSKSGTAGLWLAAGGILGGMQIDVSS